MAIQPQKSEVHDETGDASTSPTAAGDRATSKRAIGNGQTPGEGIRTPDLHLNEVEVIQDDSDVGGPIIIKSDDPRLQHLELPADPFPTDRSPEIDPPVKK
jgi:hypothetical protein